MTNPTETEEDLRKKLELSMIKALIKDVPFGLVYKALILLKVEVKYAKTT